MRSRISWSAITSTKMRVTAVTAIAMTFATVLATARDADPAKEITDPKTDSAKKA